MKGQNSNTSSKYWVEVASQNHKQISNNEDIDQVFLWIFGIDEVDANLKRLGACNSRECPMEYKNVQL